MSEEIKNDARTTEVKAAQIITATGQVLRLQVNEESNLYQGRVLKISHVNDTKGRNLLFVEYEAHRDHNGLKVSGVFNLNLAVGYTLAEVKS